MLEAFLIPFLTIAFAEVGDKTQLLLVAFAVRHASMKAYAGAMLGFLFADGIAIIFGATALKLVPGLIIKLSAAAIFLIFGVTALLSKDKEEKVKVSKSAFLYALSLVAVSEFGDKSQIAAGLFAAQYNLLLVLLGVMSAVATITIMSFLVGKQLGRMVKTSVLKKVSGIIFIAVAVATFASAFI